MASKHCNLLLVSVTLALLLLCMLPQPSLSKKAKPKKLDFYVLIVVQNLSRLSSPGNYNAVRTAAPAVEQNFGFGDLNTFDNPISKTPSLANPADILGRVQGLAGNCGQDQLTLCLSQTLTYDDGKFSGTFSLVGVSVGTDTVKYAPIVGGTGDFAYCRGVAELQRISDVYINLEENAWFSYSIKFKF